MRRAPGARNLPLNQGRALKKRRVEMRRPFLGEHRLSRSRSEDAGDSRASRQGRATQSFAIWAAQNARLVNNPGYGFLALVPLLAACGGQDLIVRDDDAFFPTFRATYSPGRGPAPEADPDAPADPRGWGNSLEFALSGVDDSANSRDYDMLEATFAYRGGATVRRVWAIEGLVGLGYNDLNIQPLPGVSKQNHDYYGLFAGGEVRFAATHEIGLYFRATGLFSGVDNSSQVELGVSYALNRVLRLFGGWRQWELELENAGLGSAGEFDVDLKTQGIVLGLGLDF